MGLNEAREIVRALANGIDPTTGEILAPKSPYNDPGVIRALFTIHDSCRLTKRPAKTAEEKQQENIAIGRPKNAGLPWTDEARIAVASGFQEGSTFGELARTLERSTSAIRLELIRQGLVEPLDGKV